MLCEIEKRLVVGMLIQRLLAGPLVGHSRRRRYLVLLVSSLQKQNVFRIINLSFPLSVSSA